MRLTREAVARVGAPYVALVALLVLVVGAALALDRVGAPRGTFAPTVRASDIGAATSSVQPSVGLYWTSTTDPTVAPGVHAPLWQLLFRTDVPAIYVKTTTADTGWTALGLGTSPTPSTLLNPQSYVYGSDDFTHGCSSGLGGCGPYWNNVAFTAPMSGPINPLTATDGANLGYLSFCTSGTGGAMTASHGLTTSTTVGQGVIFGAVPWQARWRQRLPILGDGTNSYITRVGYANWGGNGNTTIEANGVWAEVNHTTYGDFWTLVANKSGVTTFSKCDGTGGTIAKPVVANTWTLLELDVTAAGAPSLSVDGVVCTSLASTVTPTTALSPGWQHYQSLGSLSRCVDFNWFTNYAPVSRP